MMNLISIISRHESSTPMIIKSMSSLPSAIEASGRIMVPISGGYQCCLPDEILYLKAESNYTAIYFADGTKKLLSKTLKLIEALLPSHLFFRVHKSFVVNAGLISEIQLNTHDSFIKLCNGALIPVSREKKQLFNRK
jgi:two-component system, LytTR family, response regulator